VNLTSIDVILKINDSFQIDNPHFVNYAVLPFILAVFQPHALLPSKFALPCSGITPNLEKLFCFRQAHGARRRSILIEKNSAKEVALLLPEKQEKVVFFLPFMAIDFHCESLISG
jgi:hypothetical protein